MAGNIVNLNDLVPGLEGTTFQITRADGATESYTVPGDLDTETVFEFLKLFEDMVEFQSRAQQLRADAGEDVEANAQAIAETLESLRRLNDSVKEKLLAVFQLANPDLKVLPFGAATTMVVLGKVLEMMGIASPVQELPVPPTRRKPQDRKPRQRPAARKK